MYALASVIIPCPKPHQLPKVVFDPLQLVDHVVVRSFSNGTVQGESPDERGLGHPRPLHTRPDLLMFSGSASHDAPQNTPPNSPIHLMEANPPGLAVNAPQTPPRGCITPS